MKIQYKRTMLRRLVALVMVVMRVQSVFKMIGFSKRKLLCSTIQIMLDQALFSNTNALFKTIEMFVSSERHYKLLLCGQIEDEPVIILKSVFNLCCYD